MLAAASITLCSKPTQVFLVLPTSGTERQRASSAALRLGSTEPFKKQFLARLLSYTVRCKISTVAIESRSGYGSDGEGQWWVWGYGGVLRGAPEQCLISS